MNNFVLTEGMTFKNSYEVADFIGWDGPRRSSSILRALGHYCEFHRVKHSEIIIDKVFDVPIPFLRNDYVHEIGDVIDTKYGNFKIIGRSLEKITPERKNKTRLYLCECLICGFQFTYNASEIAMGRNCPNCAKKRFIQGKSLYDERPDLHQYYVDPENAKKFSVSSGKRILCKCPDCGAEKSVMILNLTRHGFCCSACSDSVSYPNRFIHNLLDYLGVEHEHEKSFDWLPNKRYDQYLPDYSLIIENQGKQHYVDNNGTQFPYQTLKEVQQIDKIKRDAALKNGIKYYVYVDCSESTQDWIKQHIMKSELPKLLDFTENDIDWDYCDENSNDSLVLRAWEMWNSYISTKDIAAALNVSKTTVRNYIRRGINCGKCEPSWGADKETRKARKQSLNYTNGQMKPIYCVTDNVYFASKFECEEYYSDLFPESGAFLLYKWINANKPYKGKLFSYITKEEFNNKLEESSKDKTIKIFGRPYRLKGGN